MTTIQPFGDKLLIRPIETKRATSIHMPDNYVNLEDKFGDVVRLGTHMLTSTGVRHKEWPVKVGDRVSFNGTDQIGLKVKSDGEELLLIHVNQLKCIIG